MEHSEEYKGYKIEIHYNRDAANPRTEWNNVSTLCCWHSRYNLGDIEMIAKRESPISKRYNEPIDLLYELAGLDRESCIDGQGDWTYEELYRSVEERGTVLLPVYMYDHSGICISTTPYSCNFDSEQVGYIYAEKDKIEEEWSGDKEKAIKYLEGEIETYSAYLGGEVYGYQIEKWNEDSQSSDIEDSCWGYYSMEDCIAEAKSVIDHYKIAV